LGLREAVALGIGGTIGGGIFVLVGTAVGAAGPGALLSFGIAFLAALMIALPYAELACRYPLAGGGYAFAQAVLGRHWGFLMGWAYWGGYLFISGYVTLGFGGYLHALTGFPTVAGAIALVAFGVVINLAGVRLSGRVQTVVVALALAALFAFGLFGLPHVQLNRFTPFLPHGVAGVVSASLIAFLAFGGFDMVAAAGEEITTPERNLPLAIILTLVGVLGLYLLVTFVAIGLLSWLDLGRSSAPLADAVVGFAGSAGRLLIAIAALFTTAATGNAVLVVTSRISFAMARDGLFPSFVARVHRGNGAPWAAVLLCGVLLAVVAMSGSVAFVASVGGFLYVLAFLFPLVAVMILRIRGVGRPRFRTPLIPVVLPLAFAGCFGLLFASGRTGFLVGLVWLAVGLASYGAVVGLRRRRRPDETAERAR
jgi:APA family basic amino acid/polyamine antiporter